MYGVVNKKVSGWELASCNKKMHELSSADPSVSILPHSTVRKKHAGTEVIDSSVGKCLSVYLTCYLRGTAMKQLRTIDLLGLSLLIVGFSLLPFASF